MKSISIKIIMVFSYIMGLIFLFYTPIALEGGLSNWMVYLILGCIILSLTTIIGYWYLLENKNKKIKKQKEGYKIITGMIKLENKIDLNKAQKVSGYSQKDLEQLIYTLAADDQIKGHFEGKIFHIDSGVDSFIDQLEKQFIEWDTMEQNRDGKRE